MTDHILLRGHRVLAFCGVLPEEQERRQPFEVDLDVMADLSAAGASDALGDTIDYGELGEKVERAVTDGRFVLLERLAEVIADVVLSEPRALGVTVEVRKLRPPVAQQLDTSGVRIIRQR